MKLSLCPCLCSIVLHYLHALVLRSHTNTNIHCYLVNAEPSDLNSLTCLFLLLFCSFVLPVNSQNAILLYDNLVVNLNEVFFLTFSIVFPKTELFISLKKSFSQSFLALVLKSMYDFSNDSSLNPITLCIFCSSNP